MLKIIRQHDASDCAAACLSMVAWHYGLKQPLTYYRFITGTDKNGTNLQGIVNGAKRIGLSADAQVGSPKEFCQGISNKSLSFPMIAHTLSDGGLHFVVLFGARKGKLLIGDPAKGLRYLRFDIFFRNWTGYIITFQPTDTFHPKDARPKIFSSFFHLLKGQYIKLFLISFISILIATIGILGAFVFEIIIDQNSQSIFNKQSLSVIFLSLILLYCLQAGIQFIRNYLISTVSRNLDIRLSLSFFHHLTGLPVSSISLRQTGDYISRLSDTASIRFAISGAVVSLALDILMVIACGWILYLENAILFFISLIIVLAYSIIVLLYRKPVSRSNRDAMNRQATAQSFFKECIDGFETIKATCSELQVRNRAHQLFLDFANATYKNNMVSASQDTFVYAIELIGTTGILWVGFDLVYTGNLSIGSLITFYALISYFIEPIKNLIELQPMIQAGIIAAERMYDILTLPTEDTPSYDSEPDEVNTWSLSHVDYRYNNHDLTLSDVSLSVQRGEKIAIIGSSGSGKTTIAKLFLRFFEPEKGALFLDQKAASTVSLKSLRRMISYVGQDTFLFADTIKNNLLLGNPFATEDDIHAACKCCLADDFISALPLGYDTPLDENGLNLSDGQRQRLALARAILQKPQLLILDEATCHLDFKTEEEIQNRLFSLTHKMACIVITHQLSVAKRCDRIYILDNGKIIDSGTHEELLQKNSFYTTHWHDSQVIL